MVINRGLILTKLNINQDHELDFPLWLTASLYSIFQVFIYSLPFIIK